MNFLPFNSFLIPSILDGSKTCAYRYGLKYDHLKTGEIINIINSDTDEIVTQVLITEKYQIIFKDLPLSTDGHQEFSSLEEMRNNFSHYYGEIHDDDVFLVITFKLIS